MDRGYALVDDMVPRNVILNLKDEMEKVFGYVVGKKRASDEDIMNLFETDFDAFYGAAGVCQKLPALWALAADYGITYWVRKFGVEHPVFNTKPLVMFSAKRTAKKDVYWKVPAHQDWPSNLGSRNGMTVWIPLVDVKDELGPLEIVPDSHKRGPLDHVLDGVPVIKDYPEDGFVKVPMTVGDGLFFNTLTVHRSGVNRTEDRIRWAMAFRYNDAADADFRVRKYPRNRTGD